ncbi:MAG TPA: heavy metal-associated domain-containing protein, partial [Chloroflexota bacterium]|nr:heavy metal-associated domain-containing protein [Chloroflexota bacterium]
MAESAFRMRVEGMTCGDCERHVGDALARAGATAVRADFRRGEALFQAPSTVDRAALARAVADAGYHPGPMEQAAPAARPRRSPHDP